MKIIDGKLVFEKRTCTYCDGEGKQIGFFNHPCPHCRAVGWRKENDLDPVSRPILIFLSFLPVEYSRLNNSPSFWKSGSKPSGLLAWNTDYGVMRGLPQKEAVEKAKLSILRATCLARDILDDDHNLITSLRLTVFPQGWAVSANI